MLDLTIGGAAEEPSEEKVREVVRLCQHNLAIHWNLVLHHETGEIVPPRMDHSDIGDYLAYMYYAAHDAPALLCAELPEKYWPLINELFKSWLPAPISTTNTR